MAPMARVRTVHAAAIDPATLAEARGLLETAFADWSEQDWQHSLGGTHALAREGDALVGHASVVPRRLEHRGRVLRAGYVEAVAVRADRRGRGYGAALMAAVERVVRDGYDLGALSTTDEAAGFYAARGWRVWRGPLSARTPTGVRPTPEDQGGVLVLPCGVELDLAGGLTCDWREGDLW